MSQSPNLTGVSTVRVPCHGVQACIRELKLVEVVKTLLIIPSLIAVFCGLAFWSTIHLTIRILFFFQRYQGLYFWSLIITTWSLSIREAGFLMRWVAPNVPWKFSLFLAESGWVAMVTGFSIVLWSRLQFITSDKRILRGVLAMILIDGFIWHSALVTLQYGLALANKTQHAAWLRVLNPMERVQITFFTVQEVIISGLYMHATYKILKDRVVHQADKIRRALILLFVVQTVVIMLDVIIITLDLAGYFTLKAIMHSWVYGIKLELEFVVLNQLVEIAQSGVPGLSTVEQSGTEFTITQASEGLSSTLASPNSGSALAEKQDFWLERSPEATDSRHSSNGSRRPSLPHQLVSGLGLIPEGQAVPTSRRSFTEDVRDRTLSLDQIGVIPDA
jgi:hypothetical protein